MTIYLDALFFLNFFFDFLLLMTVSVTLKRNASLKRIFLGGILGAISVFFLFFTMTTILLFFFKLFLSAAMLLVTFGYKDKKYFIQNMTYFYMTSVVLGGFLYFLNLSFSLEVHNMIFVKKDISVNFLFLLIFSPVILYIYVKQRKEIQHYHNIVPVTICFKNKKTITVQGFLDTGNQLVDPITKKHILLLSKKKMKEIHFDAVFYVPFHSLNYHGLLKCISIDHIVLCGHIKKNILVGFSTENLFGDGIDCILPAICEEEIR